MNAYWKQSLLISEIKSIKEKYKSRREKLEALKSKVRNSMEQQFDEILKEVSTILMITLRTNATFTTYDENFNTLHTVCYEARLNVNQG